MRNDTKTTLRFFLDHDVDVVVLSKSAATTDSFRRRLVSDAAAAVPFKELSRDGKLE